MKNIILLFSIHCLLFTVLPAQETEYKIGIGDNIDLFSVKSPEFNGTYLVSLEGKIILPLVKDIYVKDLTLAQLEMILNEKIKVYIKDPGIIISLRDVGIKRIHVIGQVAGQGQIPYRENLYILDVISMVGGFTDSALLSEVKIYRGEPGNRKIIRVDLKKLLQEDEAASRILIEPGDIVYVPRGEIEAWNVFISKIMPTFGFVATIISTIALFVVIAK